jgi:predicted dehydrogenase
VEVRATIEGAADHPVDELADLTIRFDTGTEARVVASWRAGDEVTWDLQASAPEGVVRLELLPEVLLERNGTVVPLRAAGEGAAPPLEALGYLAQMAAFADDLVHGTVPLLGAAFGRSVLDLTCAAYQSAGQGGGWVGLPFEGPRDRTPLQLWRNG